MWYTVQRKWMYLESIFVGAEDIRLQLPEEAKKFDAIDKSFKQASPSILFFSTIECVNCFSPCIAYS